MNYFQKFVRAQREMLKTEAGFSLLEILIALTLLGIVGTVVTVNLIDRLDEGRINTAITQMSGFKTALKDFKRKCGFYPQTDQGLEALIEKPSGKECKNYPPNGFMDDTVAEIPADPWDEPYNYESDGKKFKITSYGSDNTEGGDGFGADIHFPKSKGEK